MLFCRVVERLDGIFTSHAYARRRRGLADLGKDTPAALTLLALRQAGDHADRWYLVQREGALGRRRSEGLGIRRDGDLGQIDKAFFQVNSWVGLVLLGIVLVDLYVV